MLIFSHCQHLLGCPGWPGWPGGTRGAGMQNQLDGGTAVVALLALVNGNSWLTGENGDQEDL